MDGASFYTGPLHQYCFIQETLDKANMADATINIPVLFTICVHVIPFTDISRTAYYAKAIAWANALELVNGTNGGDVDYLDPQGHATRAQVATILMRYAENVVK